MHGSEKCFRKFVNAGKIYNVDTLILGGDVTGKMIVSIVEQPDGTFESNYLGVKHVLKTQEEVQRLEKTIRYTGYYPYLTDEDEVRKLNADPASVKKIDFPDQACCLPNIHAFFRGHFRSRTFLNMVHACNPMFSISLH